MQGDFDLQLSEFSLSSDDFDFMSSDVSSESYSIYTYTYIPQRRKRDPIMSGEEWNACISSARSLLRANEPRQLITSDLSLEGSHRYGVKESSLSSFKIFPWFSARGIRFRETLRRDSS
jgi:uncharacterized protein YheU (UPF0270 family)